MQADTEIDGRVTIIRPAGSIDARTAGGVERPILDRVHEGRRLFAIDCERVEKIDSAGIHLLIALSQRLESTGGGLVLFALPDHVRTVLEVAGLTRQFRVAGSQQDALAGLVPRRETPAAPHGVPPGVTRLARLLLADADRELSQGGRERARVSEGRTPSPLSSLVAALLDQT